MKTAMKTSALKKMAVAGIAAGLLSGTAWAA